MCKNYKFLPVTNTQFFQKLFKKSLAYYFTVYSYARHMFRIALKFINVTPTNKRIVDKAIYA